MKYPDEREIVDPLIAMPAEVANALQPYVEASRLRYSRFRQQFRRNPEAVWREEPGIVSDHAADIFRALVVLILQQRPATFDEFRRAVGFDGGAALTAFHSAQFLYHYVQGGWMLGIWHSQIRNRLFELIREAEDLWYDLEGASEEWGSFLGAPTISPSSAEAEQRSSVSSADSAAGAIEPEHSAGAGELPCPGEEVNSRIALDTAGADNRSRRAMVDAFIENCRMQTGVTVTRTMIWRAVGYSSRSDFERWESDSPKATKKSGQAFARVLSTQPENFIDLLKKRRLLR